MNRIIWVGILIFLMSACGGSSGDKKEPIIDPVIKVGNINLSVTGLPDGEKANVIISGPSGFSQTVEESINLSGIEVGNYTMIVSDVTISGIKYQGFDSKIDLSLSASLDLNATITYGALTQSQGVISGFGSVFVNGTRFNTNNSIITTDNTSNGSDSDLDIGMNVSVLGLISDDGSMAKAAKIEYSAIVRGPLEAVNLLTQEVTVLGQVILTDAFTEFKDTDLVSLSPGDIIEVSAILNSENVLLATLIKKLDEADTVLILRGEVSQVDTDLMIFQIDNLMIDYSSAQVEGVLNNGVYVKVTADIAPVNNVLTAIEVEVKEPKIELDAMITLDGIISEIISLEELKFKVNNQVTQITESTRLENGNVTDLALNKRVKVFGQLNEENILILHKIRFDKPGIIKVDGFVDSIDSDVSISVLGINFIVDKHTHFIDKSALKVKHFSLTDIEIKDRVQIKAFEQDSQFIIRQLKRTDPETDIIKLEGLISNINQDENTFELNEISIITNELTKFEYDDDVSQSQFFTLIQDNDEVEIKGIIQEDGSLLAIKVEFEEDDENSNRVELKGIIDDGFVSSAEFSVNGHAIITNVNTEYEGGQASDLAAGIEIKIKGQQSEAGVILALKIEFDTDEDENEVDLEGSIDTFVSAQNFTIGEFTISTNEHTEYKNGTEDDLAQGTKVEVEGVLKSDNSILATKIEFKHDDELEIKGVIVNSEFPVNLELPFIFNLEDDSSESYSISVTTDTEFKDGSISMLANGVHVEVEGHFINEIFKATKIKFEKVEYEGRISDFQSQFDFKVDSNQVTTTEFTDFKGGTVNGLKNGIEVEVKGTLNSAGILVITKLEFGD